MPAESARTALYKPAPARLLLYTEGIHVLYVGVSFSLVTCGGRGRGRRRSWASHAATRRTKTSKNVTSYKEGGEPPPAASPPPFPPKSAHSLSPCRIVSPSSPSPRHRTYSLNPTASLSPVGSLRLRWRKVVALPPLRTELRSRP